MLKELYTSALSMLNQQTKLEVLANNLANANTTAYKRQSVFERYLIDSRANFFNVPGDVEQDDPPVGFYIDFSKGAFEQTHNPLDIAIENENGFFIVEDEQGKQYLTRAGRFELSTDGTIITKDGKKLIGDTGPLVIRDMFFLEKNNIVDTQKVEIKITEDGEVFANETSIGSIKIVKVENLNSLKALQNSLFAFDEDTNYEILNDDEVILRQGWVENSNVNIIKEMVAMIELQRLFEAGTKVIQTNDNTLDHSIRIGRYY